MSLIRIYASRRSHHKPYRPNSCVEWEPSGPPRTETRSMELDKSELVDVALKMGAGELNVRGGSPKLMEAEFRYNRSGFKPEVRYDASGFRGHLVVEEPSHGHHGVPRLSMGRAAQR